MTTRVLSIWMGRPDWRERGGPVSHLPLLIEEMRGRTDVRLATFLFGGRAVMGLSRRWTQNAVARVVLTLHDLVRLALTFALRGRPDVLHLNSVFDYFGLARDLPFLWLARLCGVAVVIKTHGSNEALIADRRWPVRLLRGAYLSAAQRITFLSPAETRELQAAFPTHADKFVPARNIVVPMQRPRCPMRAAQILFAGRFVEKKNIPALLSAFADIARQRSDARLVMAGDGPMEGMLKAQAERLGVAGCVTWTGWLSREGIAAAIAASEVVAFTSSGSEGMPMILLEAMGGSAAIVTTPQRFTRSHDLSGMGVVALPDASAESIARGLGQALDRPVGAPERARRQAFLDTFSPGAVTDDFIAIYRGMTGVRSAAEAA